MKDIILGVLLAICCAIVMAALLGAHPATKADDGRKPLTALQVDALRERWGEVELTLPYRAQTCLNGTWLYFYANHDKVDSGKGCW